MKLHQKPHRRTKRESHASIMLGLAKSELARLENEVWIYATHGQQCEIKQVRIAVEHWKAKIAAETSPLTAGG